MLAVATVNLLGLIALAVGLADQRRFYYELPGDIALLLAILPLVTLLGILLAGWLLWRVFGTAPAEANPTLLGERCLVGVFAMSVGLYVYLGLHWNLLTHYL